MATVAKRTAPTRKAAPAAPPGLTPAEVSAIQRVGAGFVASLVRPGRNVTGFLLFEIRVLVLEPGCDRADGSTRLQRDMTLTPHMGRPAAAAAKSVACKVMRFSILPRAQ